MTEPSHLLFKTTDADRPKVICDGNGEVVLQLCRRCGAGEAQLVRACTGPMLLSTQTGTIAKHRNGNAYEVLMVTNTDAPARPEYPPTVVYQNVRTKALYSRALSRWNTDSFTEIE